MRSGVGSEAHGTARERHVREIAGILGVADFVFAAPPVAKGAASREAAGDGLLVVGSRGAVIQVKAREPDARTTDSTEKAERWVKKNARKALDQGRGTRREILRRAKLGEPIRVTPVRAAALPSEIRQKYELTVDHDVSSWPVIVIVDHPLAAGVDLGFERDCVWLTLADWLELNRRLRSVSATLTYIERVFRDEAHVPLGREVWRYHAFHEADVTVTRDAPPSTLPYLAHPDEFDPTGADLFHDIMEKVWPDDGVVPWLCADDYRRVVEFLDRVPPSFQAELGWWFFRKRGEIANGQYRSSGVVRLEHSDRLVFACAHVRKWPGEDDWRAEIAALATLRHQHGLDSGAPADSVTRAIGALVEDRPPDTGVAYVFVLLRGQEALIPLPPKVRTIMEAEYGIFDQGRGTVIKPNAPRKGPCPCGSGKKYKRCCGS